MLLSYNLNIVEMKLYNIISINIHTHTTLLFSYNKPLLGSLQRIQAIFRNVCLAT